MAEKDVVAWATVHPAMRENGDFAAERTLERLDARLAGAPEEHGVVIVVCGPDLDVAEIGRRVGDLLCGKVTQS